MDAHRCQFILHRRAISAGIGIGEAQHAAVFGMENIELHAAGQVHIGGNEAQPVGVLAAGRLDIGDAAMAAHRFALENVVHVKPPLFISITLTWGLMSGRSNRILSNPFSNAADLTSMPSASTKDRKNCRAAIPR